MGTSYKKFMKRIHEEDAEDTIKPIVVKDTVDINELTKIELDEYAHDHEGIELDRRKSKPNMIKEFLTKLKGDK
jgi:hypothetical protein